MQVLQSDWHCQHSSETHKNLSKGTRCSFSPRLHLKCLAHKTTLEPDKSLDLSITPSDYHWIVLQARHLFPVSVGSGHTHTDKKPEKGV